jgi:HEAT repeat protein
MVLTLMLHFLGNETLAQAHGGPAAVEMTRAKVAALLKSLESESAETPFIEQALEKADPVDFAPEFIAALHSHSARVRYYASERLGSAEANPDASGPLLRLLRSDPDPDVRGAAARALGQFHSPATTTALLEAAESDKAAVVRSSAVVALRLAKAKEAVGPLVSRLEGRDKNAERDADVIKAILQALGGLGDVRVVPALTNYFGRTRDTDALPPLAAIGSPEAMDFLKGLMQGSLPVTIKVQIPKCLMKAGPSSDDFLLREAVANEEPRVRVAIFKAAESVLLRPRLDRFVAAARVSMQRDPSEEVRQAARYLSQ